MGVKLLSRRSFILGGIATLSYLYFDLHSIAVKRYTIVISKLPIEFQGFTDTNGLSSVEELSLAEIPKNIMLNEVCNA